jgi:acyl-CoA thioesterase FadM/glutathione S-transferase
MRAADGVTADPNTFVVYYHVGFTGRSQPLEMMLAHSGATWKRAPWAECANSTCFAAPAVGKGDKKISQTTAAAAWLADELGYAPAEDKKFEALKCACDIADVWSEGYTRRRTSKSWDEAEQFVSTRLAKFFAVLEATAAKHGSGGFMFGPQPSYVDFLLANAVLTLQDIYGGARVAPLLTAAPKVAAVVDAVVSMPAVAACLSQLPILYPKVGANGRMPFASRITAPATHQGDGATSTQAACDGFVQYLERSSPQRWLAAILSYCDTAGFQMWSRFPSLHVAGAMQQTQEHALMRTNHVRLSTPHTPELCQALAAAPRLVVRARLLSVGRTSYTAGFSLHSQGGTPLASVETVMVATDAATHTRPEPLEHAAALRELVMAPAHPTPHAQYVPPDGHAPTWSSVVRPSDCDGIGHMNNALYPLVCEDARGACAARSAYAGRAALLAAAPIVACSVSYVGQARAHDPLEIASHLVGDAFHFEVRAAAKTVAEVVLTTAGETAASAGLEGAEGPSPRARL